MLLKEKLTEALEKKSNNINSFVWKGEKEKVNGKYVQKSVRMVDCSVEDLKKFLKYCDSMLYNMDSGKEGRYLVLESIEQQRNCCNIELFLRWLDREKNIPRYVFITYLKDFLNHNEDIDQKTTPISSVIDGCPLEYSNLLIEAVINGCLDMLGSISRKHMNNAFMIRQGIWFSQDELELMAKEGVTDRLAYATKVLKLENKDNCNLRITPKGISLQQMSQMLSLHSKKYSELSTIQLETLRNRIFFSLENEVKFHIKQWENRKRQIKLVLKSKGVNID
jgi:hypothetical protein